MKEDFLALAPQSISLSEAAGAVPLVSLTAFQVWQARCAVLRIMQPMMSAGEVKHGLCRPWNKPSQNQASAF